MTDFKDKILKAKEHWESVYNGTLPVIHVGTATCGVAAGALEVVEAVGETLRSNHLQANVIKVGCIGPCYLEPLMDITIPGRPRISYANVDADKAKRIVESYLLHDNPLTELAVGHFGTNGNGSTNGLGKFFDMPMMKSQVRVVLRNCGFVDPENIDDYIARDGYVGFINAITKNPLEVINEVKDAGLRGRGGAGFPTYKKWEICRGASGSTKFVICNCSEGDPGAFMNRALIESDPHCVLEGLLIAAYAIGATHGYIYINSVYTLAIRRLRNAIQQMHEYGLLGTNILGTSFDFEVTVKEGGGAFVCGEETALIASIEGRRGMPRSRPPFPAISGLHGKPTIINNVETLGTLPNILRNGAAWYRQFGVQGNYGTKTFSLVGKVRRPGLIEVPLGMKLRQIIFDIGGGTLKRFKAVQTGGPSGGCLSEEFIDLPVEYEAMNAAGSIMGSGGMIVIDEDTCAVDLALYFLNFTQAESCGKCVPCRVGTYQMKDLLEKISSGGGEAEDIARLQNLADTVKRTSLCGLGQTAPNPVLTTLRYFRTEYLQHTSDKYCASSVCKGLIVYEINPTICNGCQQCVAVCPTEAIAGFRSEAHTIDLTRCIKCNACYEVCRYDPLASNAVEMKSLKHLVS